MVSNSCSIRVAHSWDPSCSSVLIRQSAKDTPWSMWQVYMGSALFLPFHYPMLMAMSKLLPSPRVLADDVFPGDPLLIPVVCDA